jgi:hypothetical protein
LKKFSIISGDGRREKAVMILKTFLNTIANSKVDILQIFLDILKKTGSSYCFIGGIAVNAYVEPVVSLDLDIVVDRQDLDRACEAAVKNGFKIKRHEHSINLAQAGSDLRIQLQTDSRYQDFIARARTKKVLGYRMKVAVLEDVLKGKTWAYQDETRRRSKRQKDLADIIRIVEVYPELRRRLPSEIKKLTK